MAAQILVVDDEALIRQSLDSALAQDGFSTAAAASGAEAWQRFLAARPDVVLLDLVLGDMNGLELLGRMRKDAPDTTGMAITAHAAIEHAVAEMKLGAFDFIRKPFELEEIVATVKNAVRTSTLERRL